LQEVEPTTPNSDDHPDVVAFRQSLVELELTSQSLRKVNGVEVHSRKRAAMRLMRIRIKAKAIELEGEYQENVVPIVVVAGLAKGNA